MEWRRGNAHGRNAFMTNCFMTIFFMILCHEDLLCPQFLASALRHTHSSNRCQYSILHEETDKLEKSFLVS